MLHQSKTAKGRYTPPVPYQAGMVATAIFEHVFNTAFTSATDILEIGALPATAKIISATCLSTNLAATTTADIGVMNGEAGEKDAARALTADLLYNNLNVAGAATENAAAVVDCLGIVATGWHRGVGVTLSQDQPANANKTLKLLISYIY